ncbi:hypothetical protein L1987_05466 [Smallanthus sonchifolius]|uniref:Uncharacterized protein n=1 Tax=Smallanthus sonchifolius TaxID=185202 RepID=A0ACB9JVF2_9ASTR|nr:hypothetical protein L1987_05466 [Smallanthus sonchifolius]
MDPASETSATWNSGEKMEEKKEEAETVVAAAKQSPSLFDTAGIGDGGELVVDPLLESSDDDGFVVDSVSESGGGGS